LTAGIRNNASTTNASGAGTSDVAGIGRADEASTEIETGGAGRGPGSSVPAIRTPDGEERLVVDIRNTVSIRSNSAGGAHGQELLSGEVDIGGERSEVVAWGGSSESGVGDVGGEVKEAASEVETNFSGNALNGEVS